MKYILTLSFIIATLITHAQEKQLVMYTNVVHPNGHFEFQLNKYDKPNEVLNLYTDSLKRYSIPFSVHHNLIETILRQLKNGNVQAYIADQNSGKLHPEDHFKTPIPKEYFSEENIDQLPDQELVSLLYLVEEYPVYDDETYEQVYNEETGGLMYEKYIDPYITFEYTSLTFYENWIFTNGSLSKETIGYSVNVNRLNPETGNIDGVKPLFFIYNQPTTNPNLLVENIHSITDIYKDKNKNELNWWTNELSKPLKQTIAESLLNTKTDLFSPFPPYLKLTKDQVIHQMNFFDEFEVYDDYGDVIYDPMTGEVKMFLDTIPVNYQDIDRLEFIEDWFFDTTSLSIKKDIKGVIPHKTYESKEEDLPFFRLKTEPMFLIKRKDISSNIGDTKVNHVNHIRHFFPEMSDSLIDELRIYPKWHSKLNIDTTLSSTVKNKYFESSSTNELFYNWEWFSNTFRKAPLSHRDSLNGYSYDMPKYDKNGEEMYDEVTGDIIIEYFTEPYTNKDIATLNFVENWQYNFSENKFHKEIVYQGVEILHRQDDAGTIIGLKPLMHAKKTSVNEWTPLVKESKYQYYFFEPTENSFRNYDNYSHKIYPHEREQLINGLLENVRLKKATAINCRTGKKLKPKEFKDHIGTINYLEYPSLRFSEDIFYNPSTFNFKKEVKSITLYRIINEGDHLKEIPWITIEMSQN